MKAIILAAGRGSRLGEYGRDRPKCQVELAGMTLIDRQLATLRGCGISDIVLVTGYQSEMLSLPGVRTVHNPDWAETNMVETLFRAAPLFGDDVIVAYADIVYEPPVLRSILDSRHEISVVIDLSWRAYWEMRIGDPLADAESLRVADDGTIVEIGNKPGSVDEIEGQYIGLMRFRGTGVKTLRNAYAHLGKVRRSWMADRPVTKAYMTDLLMEMILTNHAVHAVPIQGGWLEIDTADDYEKARAMVVDSVIDEFFDPAATPQPLGLS